MRTVGAVYVARIGESDVVKIGHTRHITGRLLTLSSEHRSSVTLLACWTATGAEEQRIHRALAPAALKRAVRRPFELYWGDHPEFQRFLASIPETLRVDIAQVRMSGVRDHNHHARLLRIGLDLRGEREDSYESYRLRMERLGLTYRERPTFNPFPLTPTPPLPVPTAQHQHHHAHDRCESVHAPDNGHARPGVKCT